MAGTTLTTPIDLISFCLKTAGVIGVGQTADAQDVSDCFVLLNSMIGQWNRERWLIYHLVDVSVLSTGQQSYSIGPGGDFNVPRPDRLETAYARLLPISGNSPFDFPLSLINAPEDYASISLKKLTTFPTSVFYDSAFPLGFIFPYPIPPANKYELHVVIKETITQFPTLTTPFVLPPEYIDCLIWNLSVRIRPLYQLPPEPTILALARASLAVVRSANTQIPLLRSPSAILNATGGYDPTLGNFNGLPLGSV